MPASLTSLNMLTDPVFPVVTKSGTRRWTCFSELLEEHGDFPVAFEWPRADLNVASAELAIGLLCLIYRPASNKDWDVIWEGGGETDVTERITALTPHFNLFGNADGEGPRFCQDLELLENNHYAAEALFIDTPGVNAHKKNSDLLTRRNRFPALGLKAAAMALYALQQFAPGGGPGIRTSLRGGGPMTSLVVLEGAGGETASLCRQLLVNLPVLFWNEWLEDNELGRALPWLRPTMTSEGAPALEVAETDPSVHSVQSFFGMPRRIRLVSEGHGICPLTGESGPLVTHFFQRPHGMNYSTWRHPLTPYRQSKDERPYTVKPKSLRIGFRDWVGITVGRAEVADKAFPAEVVSALCLRTSALRKRGYDSYLLAAGWAMNNMEAESYLHSAQPLYLAHEGRGDIVEDIAGTARRFAAAAEDAVRQLRGAMNEAVFGGNAKSADTALFEEATDSFFERTEVAFHDALSKLAGDEDLTPTETRARAWLTTLRCVALSIFDERATSRLAGSPDVKLAARVTAAYGTLAGRLSATSKIAASLQISQTVDKTKRNASKPSITG